MATIKDVLQKKWPKADYWERVHIVKTVFALLGEQGLTHDDIKYIISLYTNASLTSLNNLMQVAKV